MVGRYDKVCFKGFLIGVGVFKRVLSIPIYVDRPRSGYKGNKVSRLVSSQMDESQLDETQLDECQ